MSFEYCIHKHICSCSINIVRLERHCTFKTTTISATQSKFHIYLIFMNPLKVENGYHMKTSKAKQSKKKKNERNEVENMHIFNALLNSEHVYEIGNGNEAEK